MPFRAGASVEDIWNYSNRTLTQNVTFTFENAALDVSVSGGANWVPTVAGFYQWVSSNGYMAPAYVTATSTVPATASDNGVLITDTNNLVLHNTSTSSDSIGVTGMHYSKPAFKLKDPVNIDRLPIGLEVIVLEKDPKDRWYVVVAVNKLKELIPQIKADTQDKTGYGKYKNGLRKLGFDV